MSAVTRAPLSTKGFENGEENRSIKTEETDVVKPLGFKANHLIVENVVTTDRNASHTTLKIQRRISTEKNDTNIIDSDLKENVGYIKKKVKLIDILKCPLAYHTNFVGTIGFIIGCCFFYVERLTDAGYWIFVAACALLIYSNTFSAIVHQDNYKEFGGFLFYNTGSSIFLVGSIFGIYLNETWSIIYFITGSILYLIGSLFFLSSIDVKKIKLVYKLVLFVFIANCVGGLLFTIASFMFLKKSLLIPGIHLYVVGSILFTLATFSDYFIYLNHHLVVD